MNDYTLSEVFEEVYEREFAPFDNSPKHFFSFRHRKAMREILYPYSEPKLSFNRNLPLRKRIVFALLVIILSALSITAGAAISRGFARKEHNDNTELFAANLGNSPKTIERVYYLPTVPDGYELSETVSDIIGITEIYTNKETEQTMIFNQWSKSFYNTHLDNERYTLKEVEFEGCVGYLSKCREDDNTKYTLLWENSDYILQISGYFDENVLMNLAKTLEIRD